MIRFLKTCFSRRSTENLLNDSPKPTNRTTASIVATESLGSADRGRRDARPPTHRRTTPRGSTDGGTIMPEITKQPIRISLSNGEITVDPIERDLFDGEQIEWICRELAWETRFDQAGSNTPFDVDIFGPGLIPPPVDPDTDPDLPPVEFPTELSGPIRDDAIEGNYYYSTQVGGFGPFLARVKIFRRPRS